MEDSLPKIWRNHIVSRKARIVESSLIGVDRHAARVLDNYRLRYSVGNLAKFAFVFPQFLLSLLEVFDVSAYSVPHGDLPGFVAEWFETNEEPTKTPRHDGACALRCHLVLHSATAPAVFPRVAVNPPDGLQSASPNLAILQQKVLRIHAIVD